jgi:hypothetical protein
MRKPVFPNTAVFFSPRNRLAPGNCPVERGGVAPILPGVTLIFRERGTRCTPSAKERLPPSAR